MDATQVAHGVCGCLAAGLYLGANRYFLRAIQPPPSPELRRLARLVGHWLPQALVLASLVLLLQVAIAPLLLASAILCLLVPANNKKVAMLREPLLPSDVALVLRQAHTWRLLGRYVPRPRLAILGLSAAVVVVAAALIWEPWLLGRYRPWVAVCSPLPLLVAAAPWRGKSLLARLLMACGVPFWDWDLLRSVQSGGFLATFARCFYIVPRPAVRSLTAAQARTVLDRTLRLDGSHRTPSARKPHIVVVLAEAFFDPRSVGLRVEPEPLVNYAEAVRRSRYFGQCRVPVFGGWTVRSEYSLLTGVSLSSFANNVGNPNSTLVSGATHSLPKYLRSQGYRTVLVHPYDRKYYRRDKASVALGFDVFLDERSFLGAARDGTYVSDLAVAARIEEELRRAEQPTFLFCITMENHGPCEPSPAPEAEPFATDPPLGPAARAVFANYLHHLRNTDRMIGRLAELVRAAGVPTLLLLLGDHLPALPEVFAELGHTCIDDEHGWHPVGDEAFWWHTPYFLLASDPAEPRAMDCHISFLPGLLLDSAGLNGDGFFHQNSAVRRHLGGNLDDAAADPAVQRAYLRHCYEVAMFPERYASTPRQ